MKQDTLTPAEAAMIAVDLLDRFMELRKKLNTDDARDKAVRELYKLLGLEVMS